MLEAAECDVSELHPPRGWQGQGAGGCGDVSVFQPVLGWGTEGAGNVDVSVLRPVRWGSRAELGDYGGQRMGSSMFRCWSHSAAGMGEHQCCIVTALAQV